MCVCVCLHARACGSCFCAWLGTTMVSHKFAKSNATNADPDLPGEVNALFRAKSKLEGVELRGKLRETRNVVRKAWRLSPDWREGNLFDPFWLRIRALTGDEMNEDTVSKDDAAGRPASHRRPILKSQQPRVSILRRIYIAMGAPGWDTLIGLCAAAVVVNIVPLWRWLHRSWLAGAQEAAREAASAAPPGEPPSSSPHLYMLPNSPPPALASPQPTQPSPSHPPPPSSPPPAAPSIEPVAWLQVCVGACGVLLLVACTIAMRPRPRTNRQSRFSADRDDVASWEWTSRGGRTIRLVRPSKMGVPQGAWRRAGA